MGGKGSAKKSIKSTTISPAGWKTEFEAIIAKVAGDDRHYK